MENLNERIAAVRKTSGLSLRNMAKQLGVGLQTQVRYEGGKRSPPADFLQRLVEFSGVDAGWLLMGTGTREGQGVDFPPEFSRVVMDLEKICDKPVDKLIEGLQKTGKDNLALLGRAEIILEKMEMEPILKFAKVTRRIVWHLTLGREALSGILKSILKDYGEVIKKEFLEHGWPEKPTRKEE